MGDNGRLTFIRCLSILELLRISQFSLNRFIFNDLATFPVNLMDFGPATPKFQPRRLFL